jgi:hypothetical protein
MKTIVQVSKNHLALRSLNERSALLFQNPAAALLTFNATALVGSKLMKTTATNSLNKEPQVNWLLGQLAEDSENNYLWHPSLPDTH